MAETVIMDGATLSCAGVAAVARGSAQVAVTASGLARAAASHQAALEAAARSPFYGRTTGVGANGMMAVDPGNGHGLRLVRSHVGGAGERADGAVARGMLAVRLNQLAAGGSGAAPVWLEATAMALNEGLTPVFSVLGGIGTADLAGLATAALALIGERPWHGADGPVTRGLLAPAVADAEALAFLSSNAMTLRALYDLCLDRLPADGADRPVDIDIAAADPCLRGSGSVGSRGRLPDHGEFLAEGQEQAGGPSGRPAP